MKTKTRKFDGSPATYREVALLFSPNIVFMALSAIGRFNVYSKMSDADFMPPTSEQGKIFSSLTPSWTLGPIIAMNVWVWSEFVVMLLNKKRRPIHDFIAGTVMLKDADPLALNPKTELVS